MVSIFLLLSLGLLASARFNIGPCPSIELQSNFDISQYLGTWYEQARAPNSFQSGDCDTQTLSLPEGDTYVQVHNVEVVDGKLDDIKGRAYCDSDNAPHCHVSFGGPIFYGDYRVVDTDYKTYTKVWSCSNFYLFHFDYFWFMTREESISESFYNE